MVTLDVLKVPYEIVETSPLDGGTRTPEYLQLNPQHNIPVLKDGDFVMNESRAIMTYLASKQGCTKLYPTDLKTRARVDQRLNFEMGSFFKSGAEILVSSNMLVLIYSKLCSDALCFYN